MEQITNEKDVYHTAIYCRLSKDDEQTGESVSIETQKMMLESFCNENSFSIYDIYIDDGYSGLNFNRPDFVRLINDIENGRINLVITKDLSRLGRDYIQTGYFTDVYFSKKRVRYIAVNDGIDTNRDDNDIAPFKNILNDIYAKDLSRKVKSAKRQRAYKGYHISSQTPYGYKVDPTNRNHLVIDEEAAVAVREIFRLALEGKNFSQISRILTDRRICTPSAHKVQNGDTRFLNNIRNEESFFSWHYLTVRNILMNQVYIGNMVNHKYETINYKTKEKVAIPREKQIVVANQHEPIINQSDFEKVQDLLRLRSKKKKHNYKNVFKNLVFCSECGNSMILINKQLKSGSAPMFKCYNKSPNQCNHYNYIYYDDLYNEVLKRVQNIAEQIKKSNFLENIQEQIKEQIKTEKLLTERIKINNRLIALKKNINELYKSFLGNRLNLDDYNTMLAKYICEQKQLTADLANLEINTTFLKSEDSLQKANSIIDQCLNIKALTEEMVKQLIKRIEIGHTVNINGCMQKNIIITYRFAPIFHNSSDSTIELTNDSIKTPSLIYHI